MTSRSPSSAAGGGQAVWDVEPAAAGNTGGDALMARPAADRGSVQVTVAAAAALLLLAAAFLGAGAGITRPGRRRLPGPARRQHAPPPPSPPPTSPTTRKPGPRTASPGPSWPGSAKSNPTTAARTRPACTPARTPPARPGRCSSASAAWPGTPGAAPRSTPPPSTPAGTAPTATTTASSNVYDPGDAIPSAARFLSAHGAPGNLQAAHLRLQPLRRPTSPTSWTGPPATPPAAPRRLRRRAAPACQQAALGPLPAGTAGKVIAYAEAQLGKPYLWGATGPDAFDCSGLAMMAYRAAGITIPRTSQEQWAAGPQIPATQVQPGDLVFFAGADGTLTAPGHVGIVTGPGTMIDAPTSGQVVREESFSGSTDLVGFTRP